MKLKDYLDEHKISNRDICAKAGIAESTLSQFLNRKRKTLNFENACKLSDALGITVDKFREMTEENARSEGNEKIQNCSS